MRPRWRETDFMGAPTYTLKKLNLNSLFIFKILFVIIILFQTCFADFEENTIFVLNLESGSVICQHSSDSSDVHMHDISILCDGKMDCYRNSRINDENFPYCGNKNY